MKGGVVYKNAARRATAVYGGTATKDLLVSCGFVDRLIWRKRVFSSFSDRSQLPVHLHKIKVVPGFDDLAVFDARDGYAGEIDRGLSRGESQTVAGVFAAHAAARRHHITLGNLILDHDFDVGKGFAELRMEWQKACRTAQRIRSIIRQAVRDSVVGE